MELLVFGLNHRTAPVEERERWAFSREDSLRTLSRLREHLPPSEHVILSTCNRTEFYSHVPIAQSPIRAANDPAEQWRRMAEFYLGEIGDEDENHDWAGHFYLHRHNDAVEHLFRVAGGLDSMIVGESEILHQIKEAFHVAREGRATGRMFDRLFPEALKVGKRVRTQTEISKGCITPGQAALQLADEALDGLSGKRALLIGSGKIATIAAKSLLDHGLREFTIVNRTKKNGDDLLVQLHRAKDDERSDAPEGRVAPWDDLAKELASADLVITSTSSPGVIIEHADLEEVQRLRSQAPYAIIDLAIPRDIDPSCAELDGVHLFNIDALNQVVQTNVQRRHAEIEDAETIVRKQLTVFFGRMKFLQLDPVIKHLTERFEDIRFGELQNSLDRFPAEHHEAVDEVTRRLVNKLLNFPIERLKAIRNMEGIGKAEVQFLKRLFLSDY